MPIAIFFFSNDERLQANHKQLELSVRQQANTVDDDSALSDDNPDDGLTYDRPGVFVDHYSQPPNNPDK